MKQNYMLLSRLQSDCEYFLGYGARDERVLYYKNVEKHIAKMREIFDALPDMPEWISEKDIDRYEILMMPFEVSATYEGNTCDLVDIELSYGKIICGVPYYDREGVVISYDEALELYGEDGLADDIWSDPEYIKHIKNNI